MIKVISKFPSGAIGVDAVFARANWELDTLEPKIGGLSLDSCVEVLDKGLIDGCYVSEFTIRPFVEGEVETLELRRLDKMLAEWRQMATPPDLYGC